MDITFFLKILLVIMLCLPVAYLVIVLTANLTRQVFKPVADDRSSDSEKSRKKNSKRSKKSRSDYSDDSGNSGNSGYSGYSGNSAGSAGSAYSSQTGRSSSNFEKQKRK